MSMKFNITESDKHQIQKLYGLSIQTEETTPLQKLKTCKFTTDGKYIVYEGKAYLTRNGMQVPLNEEWSLSDVLHTGADLLSMGMDFVIPGSGAVVDGLNAISYVIEAQFKPQEERDSLYIMAAITWAFVIIPGPLQSIAVPLKRAVKTGVGMTSKVVVNGLKIIGNSLDFLLARIPSKLAEALKSPLAKNIMGKWGGRISEFLSSFTSRIKLILGKITGKVGKESVEKGIKEISGDAFFKSNLYDVPTYMTKLGIGPKSPAVRSYYIENAMKILLPKIKNLPKKFDPSKVKILSKSNFAGREVMEVSMENGQKVVWYKSTGTGSPGIKNAGEWYAVPGFAPDGFFIKNMDTIDLCKGNNSYLTEMSKFLEKEGVEELSKRIVKTSTVQTLSKGLKTSLTTFFSKMPKISKGSILLKKLGFVEGKTYKFVTSKGVVRQAKIEKIVGDDMVKVLYTGGGVKNAGQTLKMDQFFNHAIGAPWGRRGYTVAVPFFIKRFADFLGDNGMLDFNKISTFSDLDPNTTSKESMDFLGQEVSSYQGDSGSYTVNTTVQTFQRALMLLGSTIRGNDDGKFGPETKKALENFQKQNGLDSSLGKMDRYTAKKLSEVLLSKKPTGNFDYNEIASGLEELTKKQ